jgi:hypothetical protein
MNEPQPLQQATTRSGRWKMFGVLAVCAAPVIASYFTYYAIRPEGRTNYSALISPPKMVPDRLQGTDPLGAPKPLAGLRGQWLVVVASGAACDAGCEKLLWLQRQTRLTLGREKDRVDNVFVVTDSGQMAKTLDLALAADPALTVLRVPEPALRTWLEPATGHKMGDHLYIIDPMGNWMMRSPAQPDPGRVKKDLEKLLRASSSWDQAGRP